MRKLAVGTKTVLTGELTSILAYGSPNFGENPETDRKEPYLALAGFGTFVLVESNGSTSEPIVRVQLVFDDKHAAAKQKANELVSKAPVKVSGTIWGASTGHHHEAAILIVDDVQPIELHPK
jgi:hypothetical protein